jgi:hypothetical protein
MGRFPLDQRRRQQNGDSELERGCKSYCPSGPCNWEHVSLSNQDMPPTPTLVLIRQTETSDLGATDKTRLDPLPLLQVVHEIYAPSSMNAGSSMMPAYNIITQSLSRQRVEGAKEPDQGAGTVLKEAWNFQCTLVVISSTRGSWAT